MKNKTTLLLTLAMSIAMAVRANAQPLNVTRQGDKAVLFNFSGLGILSLNKYDGGIGGKYFIADNMAVRGMFLLGINNTSSNSNPQSSTNQMSFGLEGGLEYHLPLASHLSPYFGGDLSFMTSAATINPGNARSTNTNFGLGAIGGIEYFFNSNISLSAEYQFGINLGNSTATGSPGNSSLQIGFQTAGLTLAAYF